MGLWNGVRTGAFGALLAVIACGESSGNSPNPNAGAAGAGVGAGAVSTGGTASTAGAAGTGVGGSSVSAGAAGACQGSACPPVGDVSAAQACRAYLTTVCARIRECEAPLFRPCESPIDACPDILFGDGSGFTVEGVVACTEQWKSHSCDALKSNEGPTCSQVPGARAAGAPCVFDAQCQTQRCSGGVSPGYEATCGVCVEVAESHGACSEQRVCPFGESCNNGLCVDRSVSAAGPCDAIDCPAQQTCSQGVCVPLLAAGSVCSRGSECAAGLGCEIALVPDPMPEPTQGICQPLPAIGQPCLPTFVSSGLCAEGGTCDGRPTGTCVALVEIGGSCGFTSCVEGAYCNVLGYDHVPSHICYARGQVGDACDGISSDNGKAGCADGFDCRCVDAACKTASCQPSPHGADSCSRFTDFGREDSTCPLGEECLCLDLECAAPRCGKPRNFGESCDGADAICRQGLTCVAGRCAEAERDIEGLSCPGG